MENEQGEDRRFGEDRKVPRKVAVALGKIGSNKAVSDLIVALKDKDWYVRRNAAVALGGIGPKAKAAVPALVEAVKFDGNNVRGEALNSLEIIDPTAAAGLP